MGVQPTSLEAYAEIQWQLGEDQELVYNCIKNHPNMSDKEILIYLKTHHPKSDRPEDNWEISDINGRRNELWKMGLIEYNGEKINRRTNKRVMKWISAK
jgi:hypothetical protein